MGMARVRPDPEVMAAIRIHVGRRHGRGIGEEEIARERRGRLAGATLLTFVSETERSPAWFTCLLCPEGARRYRVDLFTDPARPPARHVEAIRRHFAEHHEIPRLSGRRIYRQPSSAPRALATYGRSTPLRGAHVVCHCCPLGMNRIFLEDPPYGDARSFPELLMRSPALGLEIAGLEPRARAERLEAHHRGIVVPSVREQAITRALRLARADPPSREPTELEDGLQTLLRSQVAEGTPITRAIQDLATLMEEDPLGYACQLARAIPGLEAHLTLPPERLAGLVSDLYGRLERTERTLWAIWGRTPNDSR